jgi:hypothetical protein
MFTRTVVVAVVAAASFVMAGAQAIAGDENQPEASVIGLGQPVAPEVVANANAARAPGARLTASR